MQACSFCGRGTGQRGQKEDRLAVGIKNKIKTTNTAFGKAVFWTLMRVSEADPVRNSHLLSDCIMLYCHEEDPRTTDTFYEFLLAAEERS